MFSTIRFRINLHREISFKCQNSNIIDTYFAPTSTWTTRAVSTYVAFLVYTNIWRRDLLTCSVTPMYVHTLRVCMHMRVLRTQEQLASATRSSCRNVMFAIVEYAWCTQHVGYISLPGIYMTVCISPFVALTISLIVYATENASAPLAQCWFRYTMRLPREESNVTNVASDILSLNNFFFFFFRTFYKTHENQDKLFQLNSISECLFCKLLYFKLHYSDCCERWSATLQINRTIDITSRLRYLLEYLLWCIRRSKIREICANRIRDVGYSLSMVVRK